MAAVCHSCSLSVQRAMARQLGSRSNNTAQAISLKNGLQIARIAVVWHISCSDLVLQIFMFALSISGITPGIKFVNNIVCS